MKRTLIFNLNTQVSKDANGYYHANVKNSEDMRTVLKTLESKTVVAYVNRMATERNKYVGNVCLYELNHEHYDYFVIVVNDISALQRNTKLAYTCLRAANNLGIKAYIYDNQTGNRLFIKPRDKALDVTLRYKYEEFQEQRAYNACRINYDRLSQNVKELMRVTGVTEFPEHYKEYVDRNAAAYDVELPHTHFQVVDNIYQREGTERGARNTIGHCVSVTYNQVLDKEPDYILDEQYMVAYLTIQYYQMQGFTPNTEQYTVCPHCLRKYNRLEWIKRTHSQEPAYCKLCETELPDEETMYLIDDANKLPLFV